ncbi:MAG: hypothetical protein EAZ11_05020 [Curvibacter sp.]|nr:MAG: hypothetical protein EAZ11_05020 [Curvibacter sp.]
MATKSIVLALSCLLLAPSLYAQGGMEELLGGNSRGASANKQTVFKSPTGEWRRSGVTTTGGMDCAVNFSAATGGVVLVGPTPDGSKGTMLFMGTKLLPVQVMTETTVVLLTDQETPGRAAQPIKAFQLPGAQSGVAIATDMAATLRAMTDVKRVSLKHKDRVVFEVAMDGMFPARDALAECMGLPPITTKR